MCVALRDINFRGVALAVIFVLSVVGSSLGQGSRLELGRRVQRLEMAWENADLTQRDASLRPLQNAVTSFFSLRLSEAGKKIDEAWYGLREKSSKTPLDLSVIGLTVLANPVLSDCAVEELKVELIDFYPSPKKLPDATQLHLRLFKGSDRVVASTTFPLAKESGSWIWNTGELPEGDYQLAAEFQSEDARFKYPPITISRIANLDSRLMSLKEHLKSVENKKQSPAETKAPEGLSKDVDASSANSSILATLRNEVRLVENMQTGKVQEADFPMNARLNFCELLAKLDHQQHPVPKVLDEGQQYWMNLAAGNRSVRTRIQVPNTMTSPRPVLFLFHGAGGSENMFFQTYGAGKVVAEATQRGWIVVCPGQGLLGLALNLEEMLDALECFIPCDRNAVMLVGHSMGAMQVMNQVKRFPELPIAAVAVGGGRSFRPSSSRAIPRAPWFVTAGTADFGRSGGRALHESLQKLGCDSEFHLSQAAEHLTSVQASIGPIFEFLDQVMKASAERQ